MRWVEVEIKATAGSVDAASNVLVEAGCSGAVVDPGLSSASEQPQPIRVMGYLPVDDRLEERLCDIRSRIARFPEHGLALESEDIAVKWVEDQEWATAWKKHFKPIKVGRVVVKPSWEPFSAGPDEVVIDIDPDLDKSRDLIKPKKLLSNREKFEILAAKNPLINQLRDNLDLIPDQED